MSKRKKRSKRYRSRTRKDKHKKRRKKKGKDKTEDKAEKQKQASRKKKRVLNDKDRLLKAKFKARQRKQDIIFIISIIIFALSMFGGYYLYDLYWNADGGEETSDSNEPRNDNTGIPDNGDGQVDSNKIEWHIYEEGMQLSKSKNKPVMIDFYFDGCYWCDELEKNTYTDSRVIEKAKSFVSIKVDTHENNAYNGPGLASQYNIQGCPTIVFLDAQGNEVNRVGGYEDANQFFADMDEALKKS